MRKRIIIGICFVLIPLLAVAQSLTDFALLTYLDRAVPYTENRVLLQGWTFECRSGLQPVTQRLGAFTVSFSSPGRSTFIPPTITIEVGDRPDVAAAYTGACPAIGPHVGFAIFATAPPCGSWTANLSWATWDGAGRIIQSSGQQPVIVP